MLCGRPDRSRSAGAQDEVERRADPLRQPKPDAAARRALHGNTIHKQVTTEFSVAVAVELVKAGLLCDGGTVAAITEQELVAETPAQLRALAAMLAARGFACIAGGMEMPEYNNPTAAPPAPVEGGNPTEEEDPAQSLINDLLDASPETLQTLHVLFDVALHVAVRASVPLAVAPPTPPTLPSSTHPTLPSSPPVPLLTARLHFELALRYTDHTPAAQLPILLSFSPPSPKTASPPFPLPKPNLLHAGLSTDNSGVPQTQEPRRISSSASRQVFLVADCIADVEISGSQRLLDIAEDEDTEDQ